MANDQHFAQISHQASNYEGCRNRHDGVIIEIREKVGLEEFTYGVGRKGADHHEFAVGHVNHAHEAKDDREAQGEQNQDAPQ
jgi:hypothetical protein